MSDTHDRTVGARVPSVGDAAPAAMSAKAGQPVPDVGVAHAAALVSAARRAKPRLLAQAREATIAERRPNVRCSCQRSWMLASLASIMSVAAELMR
jgi:hypothetical protein